MFFKFIGSFISELLLTSFPLLFIVLFFPATMAFATIIIPIFILLALIYMFYQLCSTKEDKKISSRYARNLIGSILSILMLGSLMGFDPKISATEIMRLTPAFLLIIIVLHIVVELILLLYECGEAPARDGAYVGRLISSILQLVMCLTLFNAITLSTAALIICAVCVGITTGLAAFFDVRDEINNPKPEHRTFGSVESSLSSVASSGMSDDEYGVAGTAILLDDVTKTNNNTTNEEITNASTTTQYDSDSSHNEP